MNRRQANLYGTVARIRAKPGTGEQFKALAAEYEDLDVPGFVATYVYRLDDNPDDYYMAVLFEDRESYRRNAEDPAQDACSRRLRDSRRHSLGNGRAAATAGRARSAIIIQLSSAPHPARPSHS